MTEGILDVLVGVIVLGIVVSIAFGSVIPLVETSYSDKVSQMYDKTVSKTFGEDVSQLNDYDGYMDKLEAVLVTQVLDYGMPEPKVIKVRSTTVNITSTYREELIGYANIIWNSIKGDSSSTKYRYIYNFGSDTIKGDETYEIVRK